ncbi:MAG: DUF4142 domain-containing protein [Caulobacter sp.]|nr:DUF4142 domain-containing protein [Vitreoscilla sp.]
MLNEGPQTPKPEEFAASMAESDGYELAAAQTGLAQSRHPQVRAFAQRMLTEHENSARTLRDAAKAAGLKPPNAHVGGDQSRFLASLQSLRGAEFDNEYGRQQMLALTSALTMARGYAAKGSDENLRRFAASSARIIDGHLQMARQLQQSLK